MESYPKADALKILGKDAKVPDLPKTVLKARSDFDKAHATFKNAQDEIEASILDLQNHSSALSNALEQFKAKIEKEDFGLNSEDKEDQGKIKKAVDLLTGGLDEAIEGWNDTVKTLDELDKHVIQLARYEPPKTDV